MALVTHGHTGTHRCSEVLPADALFMRKDFIKSHLGSDLPSFLQVSSYFCYPVFQVTRAFLCGTPALRLQQALHSTVAVRGEIWPCFLYQENWLIIQKSQISKPILNFLNFSHDLSFLAKDGKCDEH